MRTKLNKEKGTFSEYFYVPFQHVKKCTFLDWTFERGPSLISFQGCQKYLEEPPSSNLEYQKHSYKGLYNLGIMNQMNKRAKWRLRSKSQENHFLKNKSALSSVVDEFVFKMKGVN